MNNSRLRLVGLWILATTLAVLSAAAGHPEEILPKVRDYRQAHAAEILAELAALLRLPNLAADLDDIRRNAEALRAMMERRGIRTELLPTAGGRPVVYGELLVPGATTTLLFYGHYDGQPVEPSAWHSPPFEPTLRAGAGPTAEVIPLPGPGQPVGNEWRLYARSAADDKSPLVALLAALDALRAQGVEPRVNLKFLFEGEEEAGSPHLEEFIPRERQRLAADLLIIADGPVHQSDRPTVFFGARGIMTLTLTVYGPSEPLHSGHYGNWAPNPAQRLAALLATMEDDDGRVTLAGFYDDVEPLSEREREALAAIPPVEDSLEQRYAIARPEGRGRRLAELIALPSLNIRGLRSGWVGEQARTLVPATATAELDVRLVKGNDHRRMYEKILAHIRAQGWTVFDREPTLEERRQHARVVRVEKHGGYNAVRTPMDLPIAQQLIAAVERGTGEPLVKLPTLGGSGPLHYFEELGIPSAGVPIVNFDNHQHAPDENLRLGHFFRGIDIFASLLWWED
ncbi:M20/M25/M40 family metallo-hydrolase [Acidobacteriia bacterium AH_259_A11_L15]|nr:M20/M25/M40 family metallo-hydrolase [Acidobacteriia bacterium AH_259_A11_L15]